MSQEPDWAIDRAGILVAGVERVSVFRAAVALREAEVRGATKGKADGLREAAKIARLHREEWSCAGGFGGHSAAARIIMDECSALADEIEKRGE